jgi:hypothetical protein
MANVSWKVTYPGKASVSYLPFGDAGLGFYVDDVKVVGSQGAAIADATDAASAITQLNLVLARLRAHGLIAT